MKDQINVAAIGCGLFAKFMHLPNMEENSKYKLYAACDIVEEAAEEMAEKHKMAYATTDYDKVLQDKEVDLVLITTRHNLHAEQTIKAAKAGKHILCEKPMALNFDDCHQIMTEVKKSGVKYTIGYNRGLAPSVTRAREIIRDKKGPLTVFHRMAGYIPADHWLLDEKIGGGLVVGEGCHVFDLFCKIADSEPTRVYAEGGVFTKEGADTVPDTQVVTIGFKNDSIATMVLASVGNPAAPKEFTEIYCGQTTIFIDDFKEMRIWDGDATLHTITPPTQDKGHKIEIDILADAILNDKEPPNGLENACRAALMSYKVHEAIKTGTVQQIDENQYRGSF